MNKLIGTCIALFIACIAMAQPPNVPAESGAAFGEKVTAENSISVEQLVSSMNSQPESNKKMDVKLQGVVTEVCEAEGCWLKIQNGDGSMMVRMKDHAFFVPVALAGKKVVVEGTAEQKTISAAMLKHYAEDAGKSKSEIDAIKEDRKDIVIQATGILVL